MRISLSILFALAGAILLAAPVAAQSVRTANGDGAGHVVRSPGQQPADPAPASGKLINLNTATLDQLETLPGIGRKTAERIIEYRTKAGSFKKIEELMNVKGIGEKSFLKLKPLVVVAPAKGDKAPGD